MTLEYSEATVVLGIAGGSASGKSTVARELQQKMGAGNVQTLSFDRFYRESNQIPKDRHGMPNYDHPAAMDADACATCMDQLVTHPTAEVPVYDFVTHARTGSETLQAAPLLIVEGLLALHFEQIRRRCQVTVFLDVPEDVRYRRRLARDMEDRGRTAASVQQQWQESVAPMHAEYIAPSGQFATIVDDGQDMDRLIGDILEHLSPWIESI